MSEQPKPARKPIDGFVRRPVSTGRPVAATVPDRAEFAQPGTPEPAPVRAATAPPEPVFEYRKPKRRSVPAWLRPTKRRVLLGVLAVVVIGGGVFGWAAFNALGKITGKGGASAIASLLSNTKLKGEDDGRINVLLLGIGGGNHDGGDLSDTNIVMSIDTKTKDVAMLSIPRDMYVKLGTNKYGKLNEANSDGGAALSESVVETMTGLPIHYYLQVDFDGFKQAIDAVGGVDITVTDALYDAEYPCDNNQYKSCGYKQPAGQFHMSGTQALKYARCRKGNCGDDFGRAQRQQQVIVALQKQAMSASTLSNPVKVIELVGALGDNVKTDMQTGEIKSFALIAKDIDRTKIISEVLTLDADSYLTEGQAYIAGVGSILIPKAGVTRGNYFDYSDIKDLAKNIFTKHYVTTEAAKVEVQNGSGVSGVAATEATALGSVGMTVTGTMNAAVDATGTVIYDLSNGAKPYTIKYLEARYGVTATTTPTTGSPSAPSTTSTPDIRIILGSDYAEQTSTVTSNESAR